MDNPTLNRLTKKDNGRGGRAAEVKVAARLKGKLQPGSGSIDSAKGDVVLTDFLVENKTTQNNSFSIKLEHLLKIRQEALDKNKDPALSFQFINQAGKSKNDARWVCIPESVFKELLGG